MAQQHEKLHPRKSIILQRHKHLLIIHYLALQVFSLL
jgi:hypothetical protein